MCGGGLSRGTGSYPRITSSWKLSRGKLSYYIETFWSEFPRVHNPHIQHFTWLSHFWPNSSPGLPCSCRLPLPSCRQMPRHFLLFKAKYSTPKLKYNSSLYPLVKYNILVNSIFLPLVQKYNYRKLLLPWNTKKSELWSLNLTWYTWTTNVMCRPLNFWLRCALCYHVIHSSHAGVHFRG